MNSFSIQFKRTLLAGYAGLFVILFSGPLLELMRYSLHLDHSKYSSYIVLIPLVSGYLLYEKKNRILENRGWSFVFGIPTIIAGVVLLVAGMRTESILNNTDHMSLMTLSVVVCWIGGFLLLFGPQSFRSACFPLLFLLFLIPIPTVIMEIGIHFLQAAAAEMSYLLFQLTGIPVARDGTIFYLPGMTISIAPACSGMRATITLFVISILAGHLFLRSDWKKIALVFSTFPITILGNSIRIVGLTLMALYVNQNFMNTKSALHERGGLMFFIVDLIVLGGVIALMRKEKRSTSERPLDQNG